jgi:hypothetical protein
MKIESLSTVKKIPLRNKEIRSKVLKKYLGDDKTFCFSCGNAVKFLRKEGVNVIGISEHDLLKATREIGVFETKSIFDYFDSTSGHLPLTLCREISDEFSKVLPEEMFKNEKLILVPMGSGETLFCLSFLFPVRRLVGIYNNDYPPIKFDMTPLKDFIENNFRVIFISGKVNSVKSLISQQPYRNCYFIDTEPWSKK